MCRKKQKKSSGFTLVELIVVISILALLAAVAIPKYNESRTKAAETAHQSNVKVLESAGLMYIASEGVPGSEIVWSETSGKDIWNNYLNEWPKIPSGYNPSGSNNGYEVTISTSGEVQVAPQ